MVSQIDSAIDLKSVPIVGDSVATVRLDSGRIQIDVVDNALAITSFEIDLAWGQQAVGQLNTSASHLVIGWQKAALQNVASVAGPAGTATVSNHWTVRWEGIISENWHLSADLQYSNIQVSESAKATDLLVVSGAVLNTAGDLQAGELTNVLTSSADKKNTLWQDTLPRNVGSTFTLRQCAINCALGGGTLIGVAAQASWGLNGRGTAALIVQKIENPSETSGRWAFALAIGVQNFRFSDILSDSQLATMVDNALFIADVSALAFYNPKPISLSSIVASIQNMRACNMFPPDSAATGLPLASVPSDLAVTFTSGVAFFAELEFNGAPDQSLNSKLSLISSSPLPKIRLLGYCGKASDSKPAVVFTASISLISLFSSVTLRDIAFTYAPTILQTIDGPVRSSFFTLQATCYIQFSASSSWGISGTLTIQDATAAFVFETQGTSLTLSETFNLRISDVRFRGDYTFASSSSGDSTKGASQTATYSMQLSATVSLGSVVAQAYVLFAEGNPGAFVVQVPGKLSLSALVHSILGDGSEVPEQAIDVSFSNLLVYYAWKTSSLPSPGHTGPRSGKYLAGFHAEASIDLFGISFVLTLDIIGENKSQRGVRIAGTKSTPVTVVCIVLHGRDGATTEGPSFGLSTCDSDKGCFITAGVTFLGSEIGSTILSYRPSSSSFLATVDVKASFLPKGQAEISFELVRKDDRNRLRFVNLPAIFEDLIEALQIIEVIEKLSALDGSPCGAIKLAFDQLKTTLHVQVKLSDSQPGQSPDDHDSDSDMPAALSFDVGGTLDLIFAEQTIAGITFDLFTIRVDLPAELSLESFGSSLAETLKRVPEAIVKGLWDNKEKLAQVIALVAFKKLGADALATLICRGYYKPKTSTGDEPGTDQKADKADDGGGLDGDTGAASGAGAAAAAGGAAVAAAAAEAGATAATLAWTVFTLFAALFVVKTLPTPPARPGSPPTPSSDDAFGQAVYDAISKKFDRWKDCTDYESAVTTVLACAQEYRAAIKILRKILQSDTTAPKLGNKEYTDYTQRRAMLVYDFSLLSRAFADRWLDMSDYEISISLIAKTDDHGRQLRIKWDRLRVVQSMATVMTVSVSGGSTTVAQRSENTITVDIPDLSILGGLHVDVDVTAMAAIWGDDKQYAFYSQGRPTTAAYVEWAAQITSLNFETEWPNGVPSGLKGPPSTSDTIWPVDSKQYPVLLLGAFRYWPLSYIDNRMATGLTAQDWYKAARKTWEKSSARYVYKAALTDSSTTVTFTGQNDNTSIYTLSDLVLSDPPPVYRARVTTRDARLQPAWSDCVYSAPDLAKYPVLVIGPYTFWPVVFDPTVTSMAFLVYNAKRERIGQVEEGCDRVATIVTTVELDVQSGNVTVSDSDGVLFKDTVDSLMDPLDL
ncbi:hypothetical protein DENSPDRAFT_662235 [Dentipellis sp. KUC8613]|nr:hypothetical protein DENSPDRAFT_662235 [Dentipellis sp. KUC8613]